MNHLSLWWDTKCWSNSSCLYKLPDFHIWNNRSTTKTVHLVKGQPLTLKQLVYFFPLLFLLFFLLASLPFRFELWAISGTNIFLCWTVCFWCSVPHITLRSISSCMHKDHGGIPWTSGDKTMLRSTTVSWFWKKYQNSICRQLFFSFYNFNFVSILSKF